jgi:lambda family phage portal protein
VLRGQEWGALTLQLLDIDRLDEQRNDNLAGGGAVKMGVQVDRYGRRTAYHVLKQHPGELGDWNSGSSREYEIIPADQVVHLFIADWPEQVRGFPWMHAAMVRLWHMGEFETAAVINARIGANKIAVLQSPDGEPPEGMVTGKDSAGNLLHDAVPGQYWTLPEGVQLASFTPQFPDQAVEPFVRGLLRGVASAVGMSYHSLANDPQDVNFSTGRIFRADEGDNWMMIQQWYIEHLCDWRWAEWLRGSVLQGALPTTYGAFRDSVRFQPKTFPSIDPEKENRAQVDALDNQLTSRTRISAERGEDWEDVVDELAEEKEIAKDKGIELGKPKPEPAAAAPAAKPKPKPGEGGDETEPEKE